MAHSQRGIESTSQTPDAAALLKMFMEALTRVKNGSSSVET
jgi:hypothetical protein